MKKFITTKINKQQWRITVPNLNTNLFRKSLSREDDKASKLSSGFYDFTEAQNEFDQTRSLPNSVYIESSSTSSGEFEDARAMSDTDVENFQDLEPVCTKIVTKDEDNCEYDVPRISFKFFGDEKLKENDNIYENDVKIVLTIPEDNRVIVPDCSSLKDEELSLEEYDVLPPSHPSEKFMSHTEVYVKSLESIPLAVKSAGSDPNVSQRCHSDNEDYYQVPRPLKVTSRLSQSLQEFDIDKNENTPVLVISNHSSIEHISASQIIIKRDDTTPSKVSITSSKSTSKLPKLKKPKILKKENWDSFKTKFNNIMQEQASKQRVGAFNEKEKITINLEEMYKNSKTKCKKVFENTSKMFKKKIDNSDVNSETARKVKASDIEYKLNYSVNSDNSNSVNENIKSVNNSSNETFSEIDLNDTGASEESKISSNNNHTMNDSSFSNDSKLSGDDSRRDDFDFGAIKNAFKKRLHSHEVSLLCPLF